MGAHGMRNQVSAVFCLVHVMHADICTAESQALQVSSVAEVDRWVDVEAIDRALGEQTLPHRQTGAFEDPYFRNRWRWHLGHQSIEILRIRRPIAMHIWIHAVCSPLLTHLGGCCQGYWAPEVVLQTVQPRSSDCVIRRGVSAEECSANN